MTINYSRSGTPTTAALERKITQLEGGSETVCFASGMAALSAVFLTLLRTGDHIVVSRYLFSGTNSVFGILADFGVSVSYVDTCRAADVEAALQPKTRFVFAETIANPVTQIPDLEGIGRLCRERGLLLVIDNTVTSPALFRPRTIGAGLVVNSLSKTIGGHGAALGGAVTETGEFDWTRYPNIAEIYRSGAPVSWGIRQIRKKGLRDMGASLSSDHAHRIAIGAETLGLRVARAAGNALSLAHFLHAHPAVGAVHYPGLDTHPQHDVARRLFGSGSWLLSFELRDPARVVPVLDRLSIACRSTGMGDTRTLVIPVAPTIYHEVSRDVRARMQISDGLVRVSLGLEEVDDLVADFRLALEAAG